MKIQIVFFGSPEISANILHELTKYFQVIAVVTQPDKPVGRKKIVEATPVKKVALQNSINILQPQKTIEVKNNLELLRPLIGIVFAYGEIIPRTIIDIFPRGILNIHPSLLPKYRGPSPVQTALLHGETHTGVTIIQIDEQMDHGPIVAQEKTDIFLNEKADELLNRLSIIGTKLLIHTLPKYINKEISPEKQEDSKAVYCKIIKKEDGKICWDSNAKDIYNQFRALYPWPGIFTVFDNKRLKILQLHTLEARNPNTAPGTVFLTQNNELAVQCAKFAVILDEVQIEGKKPVLGKNFILGYKNILNTKLV